MYKICKWDDWWRHRLWDWIKYNIGAHASRHSKKKRSKERGKKELSLQYELNKAKQASVKKPCDSLTSRCHEARENLEAFYEEKTKGIIIRARARWHEHGEKSIKYCLNLEKRNHVKKNIRKIVHKWKN